MIQKTLAVALLFCATFFLSEPCQARDTSSRLVQSIQRLNTWLGDSPAADGWRRSLRLNILEAQAAKGYRANVVTLQDVLNRFNTSRSSHPAFSDVRNALQQHIQMLSLTQVGDIYAAVEAGKNQFRQTTIAELANARDMAVYDASVLKKFYAVKLSDFDRQEVFGLVKVDEMIAELNALQFELPPENSAGKLSTQISELQAQLNALIEKRDALPAKQPAVETPQTDDGNGGPNNETENAGSVQDDDREKLQAQIAELEKQIAELRKQRTAIATQDRPRQQARAEVFRSLRKYNDAFDEAFLDYHDAYLSSSRSSFSRFIRLYIAATDDNLENKMVAQLDTLSEELVKLNGPENRVAATRIGAVIGWLENNGQLDPLVGAIRARYSMPNAHIAISHQLVNELASQPVNNSQAVAEDLLGRFIQGQAHTNGQVTIDLIDNPDEAQISIHMQGLINSDTFTKTGPITAYAGSNAQIEARRSVFVGLGGLVINDPYVAANLQSYFKGINSRLRLIQRFADKAYLKDKALSEGISAGRIETRLVDQFRTQTDEQLVESNKHLKELKLKAMDEIAMLPDIVVNSSSQHILVSGIRSEVTTLAAPTRPAQSFLSPEIAVRIHETMASNYVDPIFAGKTFTSKELGEKATELLGESPKAFEGEDWAITFAGARPIQFEFENNRFAVVVNGRKFEQEGNEISAALEIRLEFMIQKAGDKMKFVRFGEAKVEFLDPDQKNAKTVGFASFLERKMNEEPADGEGAVETELPDNLIPLNEVPELADSPIAQKLRLVQCRVEQGWLYIGWNHDKYGPEGGVVDLPAIVNRLATEPAPVSDLTQNPNAIVSVIRSSWFNPFK